MSDMDTSGSSIPQAVLERAARIRLVVFDVDGVLSNGQLYYDEQGRELKAFHARDGLGMKRLQHYGFELAIITGRDNPVVSHRMRSLGIAQVHQGRHDKLATLKQIQQTLDLDMDATCFVGDDLLDLSILKRAGLAVAVADAHPWVLPHVHWVTRAPGGHGAAREVCDLLLQAQGHQEEEIRYWSRS